MDGSGSGIGLGNGTDQTPHQAIVSHVGILTRRVVHSPVFKWVLPARIREEKKNDVVFIGENIVELKEWDAESGCLREVAVKTSFGSRIRCAGVVGDRGSSGELDQNHGSGTVTESALESAPSQVLVLVLASYELLLITAAEDDAGQTVFHTRVRKLPAHKPLQQAGKFIATDPKSRSIAVSAPERTLILYSMVPPRQGRMSPFAEIIREELILSIDIVILKMDFLYPPEEDADRVMLIVIGVKAGKTYALVYSWDSKAVLRPGNVQINRQALGTEHSMPFSLIPLKTAGYFMLIEEQKKFLYLVSTAGSVEQTDSASIEGNGKGKRSGTSAPGTSCREPLWTSWARPVRNPDWGHEAVYLGREDGTMQYVQVSIKPWASRMKFDVFGHGGNLRGAIDTAFAILDIPQARNDRRSEPTNENVSLELPNYKLGYPDALVAPGSFSDGGLYEIGLTAKDGDPTLLSRAQSHEPPMRVKLRNWAPFSDLAVMNPVTRQNPSSRRSPARSNSRVAGHAAGRTKLLATSGKEPHGTIAELRVGLEIECKIPRRLLPNVRDQDPDFDLRYCNGIWPIELPGIETLIIFSFPWRTVYSKIDRETLTISLVESDLGGQLTCDEPTLAAGKYILGTYEMAFQNRGPPSLIPESFVVNVTSTQVQLLKLTEVHFPYSTSLSGSLAKAWPIQDAFLAACQRDGPWLLIATQAGQAESRPQISLKRVISEDFEHSLETIGPVIDIQEDISWVSFLELCPRSKQDAANGQATNTNTIVDYAAIGTTSGKVHFFSIDKRGGLGKLFEHQARRGDLDIAGLAALESVAAVWVPGGPDNSLMLLCGSREGFLHVAHVQLGDTVEVRTLRDLDFGNGSIRVSQDLDTPGHAIVCCGSDICQVDLTKVALEEPKVTSMFYTDALDPSYSHANIDGLCHLPSAHFTGSLSGCLVSLSNSQICLGVIERSVKHIPLRRKVPGTPTKLLYSEHLNALIVASTVTQIYQGRRYAIPTIALLDPDVTKTENVLQEEIDEYDFKRSGFRLEPGERLCGMIEWFMTKNNHLYHFIVASTAIDAKGGGEAGRIVFLRPTMNDEGRFVMKFVFDKQEVDPVFAICQNEKGSLIYGCGNDLFMRTYDPETKRFEKRILKSGMASSAVQITAVRSFVIVTTRLHSTLMFHFDDNDKFVQTSSDARPRAGISHLVLLDDQQNVDLTFAAAMTDGRPAVVAWQGSDLSTAAEAPLPCRVTRLAKAAVRPRWKQRQPATVIERDIVGTATDGSVFAFSVLDAAAWRLLYLIQAMCFQDNTICPATSPVMASESYMRVPLSPANPEPAECHIDGDVLTGLIDATDPAAALRQMLDSEPPANGIDTATGMVVDCRTARERRAMFRELVEEVVNREEREAVSLGGHNGLATSQGGTTNEAYRRNNDNDDDAIKAALQYMRNLLELPF